MRSHLQQPRAVGQLVFSPADPTLGVGVVTNIAGAHIRIRFLRLSEDRLYTTRTQDLVVARYIIGPGEKVHDRQGHEHKVRHSLGENAEGLMSYELFTGERVVESELVPSIRDIGAKERLGTLSLVHPEMVRSRLQGLDLMRAINRPGHAAILGSRVVWLAHQIDVARRALTNDPVRMLLADEVGLGKTVEAALIYAALREERRADRVLILTPDALTIQWLGEIFRKTHELLVLLDESRLQDAAADFPDLNPFEAYRRVVTSIDWVVTEPGLAEFAAKASWDLVIVDEAHHLRWRRENGGNPSYRLVEALAQKSRHLLLLTATPMALDPAEYHALLRLLDKSRFDEPSAFRSVTNRINAIREGAQALVKAQQTKTAVPKRSLAQIRKVLADDKSDLALLVKLDKTKAASNQRGTIVEEILSALRERHGLAEYVVRNRRGPVGGLPARKPQVFALDPMPQQGLLIELGESVMLDLARTIDEPTQRYRIVGELLRALWATPLALDEVLEPVSGALVKELAPHIQAVVAAPLDNQSLPTGDARLRWLVEQIRLLAPEQKMLVFVESSVAVRALKQALDAVVGGSIATFHRGLSPRDQDRQVAYFRDPQGPQLMLSTEAGGEGRNFQFCHTVVLYDLPWRPATIEQRIGRVDRVGQKHDVEVLVPYFRSGYEAAILKVMQQSIGVLDNTVGGIDHSLEYVSDKLAELILSGAGIDKWKKLYHDTEKLVTDARARIQNGIDPILDHASFSPEGAMQILNRVPADLEGRTETFVHRFAEHSHVDLRAKGAGLISVDGAPGAAGREDESGYVATFSRTLALDHEDVEFLSFGHPLVEQAFDWAREASDATAALAIGRGFAHEGAVFLWSFAVETPEDVPEAAPYLDMPILTFAVDEEGKHMQELDDLLLSGDRNLDRMDPAPLKTNLSRWQGVVDTTYENALALAQDTVRSAISRARERLDASLSGHEKSLRRAHTRELFSLGAKTKARATVVARQRADLEQAAKERARMNVALEAATPRLIAAVAVRLLKSREVSA